MTMADATQFVRVNLVAFSCTLETFRYHSYFSDIAVGVISGFSAQGSILALQAAAKLLHQDNV